MPEYSLFLGGGAAAPAPSSYAYVYELWVCRAILGTSHSRVKENDWRQRFSCLLPFLYSLVRPSQKLGTREHWWKTLFSRKTWWILWFIWQWNSEVNKATNKNVTWKQGKFDHLGSPLPVKIIEEMVRAEVGLVNNYWPELKLWLHVDGLWRLMRNSWQKIMICFIYKEIGLSIAWSFITKNEADTSFGRDTSDATSPQEICLF